MAFSNVDPYLIFIKVYDVTSRFFLIYILYKELKISVIGHQWRLPVVCSVPALDQFRGRLLTCSTSWLVLLPFFFFHQKQITILNYFTPLNHFLNSSCICTSIFFFFLFYKYFLQIQQASITPQKDIKDHVDTMMHQFHT